MKGERMVRFVAWGLFILGLALFNAFYFLGNYEVGSQTFNTLGKSDQSYELLEKEFFSLRKEPSSALPFGILKDLNLSYSQVEEKLIDKNTFSRNELKQIVALWKIDEQFVVDLKLFGSGEYESMFDSLKAKNLIDFGGWLDDRQYDSEGGLFSDLDLVQENIVKYGPVANQGFDRYKRKTASYQLLSSGFQIPAYFSPWAWVAVTFGFTCLGGVLLFLFPANDSVRKGNYQQGISSQGWAAALLGSYLILFYLGLYFFQEYMVPFVTLTNPISIFLKGQNAGPFFMYGLIYTLVILVMGVRMLKKHHANNYQKLRTASVMFFQLAFAFLIPEILVGLNKPYYDFKNIWPLDYDFFFDFNISSLISSGGLGIFMLFWGILLIIIAVPVLTYFLGKRWYCSWVCGCGGLAETAGDPFRQLSDKSLKAWQIERYSIHAVFVFATLMTALVLYTYFTGNSEFMGINSYKIREVYGAWIGAGFAGVVGTGFYPLMGNRVWCRFGCPLAAYLGFVQRFKSRFRITTNGGQCISCGNCSTYCEMGIDVRWYAQRGQNIVRSSCVGCGICSAVCPRGVLKLENTSEEGRLNGPNWIGQDISLTEQQLPELPQIGSSPRS